MYDCVAGFGDDYQYAPGRYITSFGSYIRFYAYGNNNLGTGVAYDTGAWQMITVTHSYGEPNSVKIYKNASKIAEGNVSLYNNTESNVRLGYYNRESWSDGFEGIIDEFSIWDYPLTEGEIAYLYTNVGLLADRTEDNAVNFKDYAGLMDEWLDVTPAWP